MTSWRRTEKVISLVGILLLITCASSGLQSESSSRLILDRSPSLHKIGSDKALDSEGANFTLWSPKRIHAYLKSLHTKRDQPIAFLLIPKIHLKVPVFNGTDDLTLDRGVGRIAGTAEIGQNGNVGIAGHRDGFFRGLKDIEPGDAIELVTRGKTIHFVIERTEIVKRKDVSVLTNAQVPSLTLVTCFPFYFVGSAPQRFIVHAASIGLNGLKVHQER
jgi:sortase A